MAFTKQKTPIVFGDARFTVYSEGCVRMEYSWGQQFSATPSVLVGRKAAKPVSALVEKSAKSLTIKTDKFELRFTPNGDVFSPENLQIVHQDYRWTKQVWVPGKIDHGNLGTVTRSLDHWKWCGGPESMPVESILSTAGGHFVPDEPRVYWNRECDWPQNRQDKVQFDGYFFAYNRDYKGALQDYVNVFGPIPLVPRWTFGFWYSRWYAYTDKEVIGLVRRYRKEKIPFDVMIIDTDWRGGWGGYDWSRKYFPNPEKTLKELHDLGAITSLNDHPGYGSYETLPEDDSHVPQIRKRLGDLPHEGRWCCDWSNKKAVKAWKDVILGPFHDQGMDFWWIDGWIKTCFSNMDSQLWANHVYFELAEEKTKKRGMILARWGGIGSHRFPVQFSGDTPSDWPMLQHQIDFTASSAGLGAIYWSHDIGGFFGKKLDEELFIRWSQFGAMSPVFRTHSDHGIREPWKYSKKALGLFRKQTRIRYALAPYFYNLAREAHDTGMPICRPLYLEYNDDDGGALGRRHQYLIGRDILVVPADGPVDPHKGTYRKRAYFPNGTWIELETGETHYGLDDTQIEIPIERIPTYVRKGAILPVYPVRERIGTETSAEVHLDYYPDAYQASSMELYEDDGESHEHARGRAARTRVKAGRKDDRIDVSVGAPKGRYKGMPEARTVVIRAMLDAGEKARTAEVRVGKDGPVTVKPKHSTKALAGAVPTRHAFAEVRVETRNQPVKVRFHLG